MVATAAGWLLEQPVLVGFAALPQPVPKGSLPFRGQRFFFLAALPPPVRKGYGLSVGRIKILGGYASAEETEA